MGLTEMLGKASAECSDAEREDITAMWRYIAYALGAPEELLEHGMANAAAALRYS